MAKPWKEVILTEGYKSLSAQEKAEAQKRYFATVIAPKVERKEEATAKTAFFTKYPLPKQKKDPSWYGAITSGLNRGIADVVGMPADIGQMAANVFLGKQKEAIGGSKWIQRNVLNPMGINTTADRDARNVWKRGAGRVSEELGATLVPMGLLSKSGRILKSSVPVLSPGMEIASATGAGLLAATAQETMPDNPYAEILAQVVGGVAPDALVGLGKGGKAAYNFALGAQKPITPMAAQKAIGRQMRATLANSPLAEANMRESKALMDKYGFQPNTAQATGDPSFIGTYRSMRAGDSRIAQQSANARMANTDMFNRQLDTLTPEGAKPADFQDAVRRKMMAERTAAEGKVKTARAHVRESETELIPYHTPQQTGKGIRAIQEKSVQKWRDQSKKLYDDVDPSNKEKIDFTSIRAKSRAIISDNAPPYGDPDNVPKVIYDIKKATPSDEIIEEFGDKETFAKLRKLRTRIIRDRQMEMSGQSPNGEKIRALNNVQESVEDAIDSLSVSQNLEVRNAYRKASAHYKQGYEKFKQGRTRETLAKGRHGEIYRMPESDIGAQYFHSGKGGIEDAQEFIAKFGNDKKATELLDDFIKTKIQGIAPDGKLTLKRLQAFRNRYKEPLSVYKDIDHKLDSFVRRRGKYDRSITSEDIVNKDTETNLVKLYLDADPDQVLQTVLSGKSPIKDFNRAWNTVRGDIPAENGLRAGFHDWLKNRVLTSGEDVAGKRWITPAAIRKLKREYNPIIKKLYSDKQLKTLDDLERMVTISSRDAKDIFPGSDTAAKLQQGMMTLNTVLSRLYNIEKGVVGKGFVMREMGARIGYSLIGRHSEEVAKTIMERAYADPRFASELMKTVSMPDMATHAAKIRRHLIAAFGTAPKEDHSNNTQAP